MQESFEQRIREAESQARASLDLINLKGLGSGFDPLTTSAGQSAQALVSLARAVRILGDELRNLDEVVARIGVNR